MILTVLGLALVMPAAVFFAAIILQRFVSEDRFDSFLTRMAWPLGFVFCFGDFLKQLPTMISLLDQPAGLGALLINWTAQLLFLSASCALILILLVLLIELPFRWYAGNIAIRFEQSLTALRPLVLVASLGLFGRLIVDWFSISNLL